MPMPTTREISDDEKAYRRGVHQTLDRVKRWLDDGVNLAEIRRRIAVAVEVARELRYAAKADEAHPSWTSSTRGSARGSLRTGLRGSRNTSSWPWERERPAPDEAHERRHDAHDPDRRRGNNRRRRARPRRAPGRGLVLRQPLIDG